MKVIITSTFTFCCDNLKALEKPGKLGEFFLLLFVHPENVCCVCRQVGGSAASKSSDLPAPHHVRSAPHFCAFRLEQHDVAQSRGVHLAEPA